MPSERSSLLAVQRRQHQELEKKQYQQLQIERQGQQQYNHRYPQRGRSPQVLYNSRPPRGQNQSSTPIDLLSDDGIDCGRSANDGISNGNYNNNNRRLYTHRGEDHNTLPTTDLIQLDDDDDDVNTNNRSTSFASSKAEELRLRAQNRKKNNVHRNDGDFESINGAIHHVNLYDDEEEPNNNIEVLNSFDEEDDIQGNSHHELLGLDMINNKGFDAPTMSASELSGKNLTNDQTLWDGTFPINDESKYNIGNIVQIQQKGPSMSSTPTIRQRIQQNGAKKAISTLFGMPFRSNDKEERNTYHQSSVMKSLPTINDNFGLVGEQQFHRASGNSRGVTNDLSKNLPNLLSGTITTNTTATTNPNPTNTTTRNKVPIMNASTSLLDQVVDKPSSLSTQTATNIMTSPPQSIPIKKQLGQSKTMYNAQTTTMKTVRSPLQISSSKLDPELFMPSQQHHYVPNLSDTATSNQYAYLGKNTTSKMTFRHTKLSSSIHDSGDRSETMNTNNNVTTARSWFGGNLNTNTGSTIPSSSQSITTSSTTSSGIDHSESMKKNQYMHVIGSSSPYDQTLSDHFEQTPSSNPGLVNASLYPSNTNKTKGIESNHWNWLNIALFLSYGFTTAANLVPITLIPTIAMDVLQQTNVINDDYENNNYVDDQASNIEGLASKFASVVATYAVLGTALGKFLNGSLGDIFGARRVACYFSLLHSFTLLMLSFCVNEWSVISCCVAVEYYQSVQWPCIAVILATHYGNGILGDNDNERAVESGGRGQVGEGAGLEDGNNSNSDGKYEKGIYITSLGSRGGALFASLATTMFLRYGGMGWRGVARLASFGSFLGFIIMYLFVTDSPRKLHDPQNPIKGDIPEMRQLSTFTLYRLRNKLISMKDITKGLQAMIKLISIVFSRNVLPSLRSVLSNVTFWVVAIAHSGGLMVCSSIRILGTYFRDTSYGVISENQAGFVSLFLSNGILVGLFFGGNIFGDLSSNPKARKSMVSKLYILTVTMCYTLSFLAVPMVRDSINSPYTIASLQALATFVMGAGVAVQVYCIPAIVGCTFGANKGLYASYTDGVAYTVSSLVWRIMGNAVEEGNPEGAGWAYGWAAVALLVVLAGFLMVEFVEHYFCRGGWIGRLRDAQAKNETGTSFGNSFGDGSNVKRMWEKSHSLFKPINLGKRKGPDMNSILSIDDDDDDDTSTILFQSTADVEDLTPPDELASRIQKLLNYEYNRTCVDCGSPFPRWASIIVPNNLSLRNESNGTEALGAFCCSQCAGSHRKLGTHIVFVRSIDHDNFNIDEVRALEAGGNAVVNNLYEANLPYDDTLKIHPDSPLIDRERFIVAKYDQKVWYQYSNYHEERYSSEIELAIKDGKFRKKDSPSSVLESTSESIFDQAAPVNQETIDHYESFVRNGSDSQSQAFEDDGSMSSEESDWQISNSERGGLDVYLDL